ncbi:hypothetical protein A9Q99_00830 [Gammaproteobacteria bacterium 45_16_T64]|nr:hypothetical protein A9Q99_00830 [Gammaproteobacteria bacterium 45_16_T64]
MKVRAIYPIPRNSLVLLLVTVLLALLPHVGRLPVWLPIVICLVVGWRVQVFRERVSFPGKVVRLVAVLISFGGVFAYYGTVLGAEAGVALLILAYSYKLLEMYKERDAFLVVILSYFVVATNYLFDTSLFSTLYTLFVVVVVTASLVGMNQSREGSSPFRALRVALVLSAQSVPLMIILFIFVPRIAPVWNLNVQGGQAQTGLSDSISPGDISSLSRSAELAFTVEFKGGKPEHKDLYWRGVTYSDFDGRTWRRGLRESFNNGVGVLSRDLVRRGEELRYRVIMEPTYRRWLFTLPFASLKLSGVKQVDSLVYVRDEAVSTLFSYDVVSHLEYSYQPGGLPERERVRLTSLPVTDPRTTDRANELWAAARGDVSVYANAILKWFNREPFVYTLNPPELRGDINDAFLFDSRQGFCAHYAGAFVFLMRSVGIPARVVGGYQGGDFHEAGYLVVRQYHAHAWAEIWIESKGWVRVDPTAAVAPERVMSGPEGATTDDSFSLNSPLSPLLFRNIPFVRDIRSKIEYVNYLWSKWVVGYSNKTQMEFLSRWIDGVTPQKMVFILLVCLGLVMLLLAIYILVERGRARVDPIDALYLSFCLKLERQGLVREGGEGVWTFCARACLAFPQLEGELKAITSLYDAIRYGDLSQENKENNRSDDATLSNLKIELRQAVKTLKFVR